MIKKYLNTKLYRVNPSLKDYYQGIMILITDKNVIEIIIDEGQYYCFLNFEDYLKQLGVSKKYFLNEFSDATQKSIGLDLREQHKEIKKVYIEK